MIYWLSGDERKVNDDFSYLSQKQLNFEIFGKESFLCPTIFRLVLTHFPCFPTLPSVFSSLLFYMGEM